MKVLRLFGETREEYIVRASRILYKDGYSIAEISKKLKVEKVDVYNSLVDLEERRVTTDEERQLFIELRNKGYNYSEIARMTNRSRITIKTRIESEAKYYFENGYILTDKQLKSIKKYYKAGKTMSWIAREIEISPSAVKRRLVKCGLYKTNYSLTIPLTDQEKKKISNLYKKNLNSFTISMRIGRPQSLINDYINSTLKEV